MKKYTDQIDARLTARHKKCIEICGDLKDKKILNIGCYNGWFEKLALQDCCAEAIGIDTNRNNILNSVKNVKEKRVKFLHLSALELSRFESSYFDAVTMFDVLEHLPKNTEQNCISAIKRVLKSNGELIMSVPNNSFLFNVLDPVWCFGHRHYSRRDIEKLFSETGFHITNIDYGGRFYELISMILLYLFKWIMNREVPFKRWFDKKREKEYFKNSGFVTLFIKARSLK